MHAKTPEAFPQEREEESTTTQPAEVEHWNPADPVDPAWEKAWDEEFDRRVAEYEAGLVEFIPHEQVLAELQEELEQE